MEPVSPRADSGRYFIATNSQVANYADKLEKRRMALLVLSIALAALFGAKAISKSGVPVISNMTPELFDFF